MRNVLNQAMYRNDERKIAEIEHLSNGAALLDKVTKHMSVFSTGDLVRAVKCVLDEGLRDQLVKEALEDKSVLELFRSDGVKTGYFTTTEIRAEEEKVLRLSGYVANLSNIFTTGNKSSFKHTRQLLELAKNKLNKDGKKVLSEEQYKALYELITADSALRILRGRAGVGKSYVLGQVALIAKANNINIIGLSPTHKAREALKSSGIENIDTIKGMLFKLANGRFSLPKNSLLVVDEAGMIGNDDYQELLRVAATRKCNVILSGDERQQASVQRGGMFEIFVDKYGSSTILDIKRQQDSWGREVAMAFSKGDVMLGISILKQEGCINWCTHPDGRIESMKALLADWHQSSELVGDRLILAVKNKNVAALNHGAREYLKADGKLVGPEIEVAGNHYMKGDRILITKTNKELGLINGDLAEITHVSSDRFTIKLKDDSGHNSGEGNTREISFNPAEYYGFRHGYATTVFKAQGASIKDVYVFHDGFTGLRNSYVALSRHIKSLTLYVNSKSTWNESELIKQLSYDPEMGSSLNLLTKQELENRALDRRLANHQSMAVRAVNSAIDFIGKVTTKMKDKYLPKFEYYNYKEPPQKTESVSHVIDKIYEESQNIVFESEFYEQKLVVGGNNISMPKNNVSSITNNIKITNTANNNIIANTGSINNKITSNKATKSKIANVLTDNGKNTAKTTLSAKDKFYAKVDYARSKEQRIADLQAKREQENEILRKEARICAERIAMDLLGHPNKKLSNGKELRYGDNGKILVNISGSKAGVWYDFGSGKGGDMLGLVQDIKGCDFKEAANYLKEFLGIGSSNSHLRLVHDIRAGEAIKKYIKDKELEERESKQKQDAVNKLVQRSKDITENSIAFKYLSRTRGISCNLGNDLKTTGIYSIEKNRYLPALIAYARDERGNITGGQQILLKAGGLKADITTPKKSFGRISGSFVNLSNEVASNHSNLSDRITIIAEGIETALSVKQALGDDSNGNNKILCSLGIHNISNYQPRKGEKIIIAADNDGDHTVTNKTISGAKVTLENKGAFVEIVRPEKEGDFNDVLLSSGEKSIQNMFSAAIAKHTATSLNQYLAACNKTRDISKDVTKDIIKLSELDAENLTYIQKYKLPENAIVDAYRQSNIKGTIALDESRKSLEFAANCYKQNKDILIEAKRFGYVLSESNATKAMIGMSDTEANSFCEKIRNSRIEDYLQQNVDEFTKQKRGAIYTEKIKPIIIAEQKFLKETYESLKGPINGLSTNASYMIRAGEVASKQPELLNQVFKTVDYIRDQYREISDSLYNVLTSYNNAEHINDRLIRKIEGYKAFEQPVRAAYERGASKTVENALVAIKKEQNMLADLNSSINYHSSNQELVSKIELAYTQRQNRAFDKLEAIAQKSLETGAETKETLLKKLQNTTDLKETYNKLDQVIENHQINGHMLELNNQISKSQTVGDVLKSIDKKESFLINLDKNVKYPELQQKLLELIELAKISRSQQLTEKLSKLAEQSLSVGILSEQSIVDELKNLKDTKNLENIEKTCQKFEVAIDAQRINDHLLKLGTQKQEAKTLDKLTTTIKQEQEFLAGLHGKLKYPECHSDNLINCTSLHLI